MYKRNWRTSRPCFNLLKLNRLGSLLYFFTVLSNCHRDVNKATGLDQIYGKVPYLAAPLSY